MKTLRFIGIAGTLVILTAGALVLLAPVSHGQAVFVGDDDEPHVRALEILGGRGSQIGVSIRDVDEADVKREKLPAGSGVVIEDVRSDTPAAKAGLKAGDIVVAFDGERVRSARQFARLVEETPSGRHVKATVMRDGKTLDLEVAPEAGAGLAFSLPEWHGRRPGVPGMRVEPFEFEFHGEPGFAIGVGKGRLGIGVQELTPELAEYFGVKRGVLVNSVQPDSPAARAGLKPGDIITDVDGAGVEDSGDLRRQIWRTDTGEVTLGVTRDRKPMSIKVQIEKRDSAPVTAKPKTRV